MLKETLVTGATSLPHNTSRPAAISQPPPPLPSNHITEQFSLPPSLKTYNFTTPKKPSTPLTLLSFPKRKDMSSLIDSHSYWFPKPKTNNATKSKGAIMQDPQPLLKSTDPTGSDCMVGGGAKTKIAGNLISHISTHAPAKAHSDPLYHNPAT